MATDIELVRTLIPDTEAIFGPSENETLFSDGDITNYLTVGGNVLRAAGLAVYAIATSEALISKVIRTQDLQTDGAKVAEALMTKAKALMDRADVEDVQGLSYFDIIDYGEGWSIYPPELTNYETF